MPFFDENPLNRLAPAVDDAVATLDLSGLSDSEALAALERLLRSPDAEASYLIRFTTAQNDGRETLFLPVGRRLLQARRDNILSRCLPTPDGSGYFIAFRRHD